MICSVKFWVQVVCNRSDFTTIGERVYDDFAFLPRIVYFSTSSLIGGILKVFLLGIAQTLLIIINRVVIPYLLSIIIMAQSTCSHSLEYCSRYLS